MEARFEQLLNRLEKYVNRLDSGASAPADDTVNPYIEFEEANLKPILQQAENFPEQIKKLVQLFVDAHHHAGTIIGMSLKCAKPSPQDAAKLAEPISKAVAQIDRQTGFRNDPQYNFGRYLKDSAQAATWVLADGGPLGFIESTFQAGEFFGNGIIREFKTSKPEYVAWVRAVKEFFNKLQDFVKENYKMGLIWKAGGVPVTEYQEGAAPAPAAPKEAAPAAKPAEKPAAAPADEEPKKPAVNLSAALFGELNQGTGITGRLRKVTDDQKTKNRPREERVFTVPSELGPKNKPAAQPAAAATKRVLKPVFENKMGRLTCDNQVDQKLQFTSESNRQTVAMYNCQRSSLEITGKLNQVSLDKCSKCQIVVDTVISVFTIINSHDIDIQIKNTCSSVQVESSESVRIYVSEEAMPTLEVFSAKSSNISVYAPGVRVDPDTKEETEDMIEHALPSTLKSVFENGQLNHSFVKHG